MGTGTCALDYAGMIGMVGCCGVLERMMFLTIALIIDPRCIYHISSALGRDVALRWLAVTLVGENGHPIQVVVWEGAGLGERICCGRRASCEQGIVCGCV